MKIWGEIPKVLGIYDKQKNTGKVDKTAAAASKKDLLSISSQAKDYQTVMKALKEVPDIRQDKVSELSGRYESGGYNAKGTDIADKIIKSVLDKKV
ncbi:MAG: flagellar biosynthesis anti-sigma factor FlgM [Clostridia bacterium]|nr:flagellar biosynthesis anti-sigma factor FlgM [Clostridia bacterium]